MPPLPLPARPSLEQLRKQAKDLLKAYRAGDAHAVQRVHHVVPRLAEDGAAKVVLADVQFVLAREYGFVNWADFAHRIEALRPAVGLRPLESLAQDIFSAYKLGDADALRRLNEIAPRTFDLDGMRAFTAERLRTLPEGERRLNDFSLADAQLLVAKQSGFPSWDALAESMSEPSGDSRLSPHGLSMRPPFYRIDWQTRTLHLAPPIVSQDWDAIADVMREQGVIGLNAHGVMSDAGLERISALDFVTHLDLEGAKRVTDAGLSWLARMPQLRHLSLNGRDNQFTDRGLDVLRELKELRTFQMCWPQLVSDAGVANLTSCDRLENVNLLGTPTGDGAVRALTGKPALRQFRSGRLLTDQGLALFQQFPAFKTWSGGEMSYSLMSADAGPTHLLVDGPITDDGMAALAGLEGLFGFSLFWHASAFTPEGLKPLVDLPNLGFLGCEGGKCNDIAMRYIASIPRLRMLMAQGTVASDAGFATLSRSTTIEYIWGRECPNLTGPGFASLADMPALRGLAVSCKSVDDASLSALPRFPALKELMPMDVSDEGFLHVGRCEALEALWCMYCRDTTDVATSLVSDLRRLKSYYAGKTLITDRSLAWLARMSSLERIELWEIDGITDAGVGALAALPHLRELHLESCRGVTRAAVAAFPPAVRVTYGS